MVKLGKKVSHLQDLGLLVQDQGHSQGSNVSERGLRGNLLHTITFLVL